MKLEILQRFDDRRILWRDDEMVLHAQGMKLLKCADIGSKPLLTIMIGTTLEKTLALFRPLRHLLRIGIHHCVPLPGGHLLAVVRKRVIRIGAGGHTAVVLRMQRGNKPASKGVCVTPSGSVLIGEYAQNLQRTLPVSLYRSEDGGQSFERIYEFAPGDVRHIHFVQWDPYEDCLWLGTGDSDAESRLYRSRDNGDHWELTGGGSQLWRAVGVAFRPEALYWGTDAGYDTITHPNHVMRLDRATGQLSKLHNLQGPCHGNGVLGNGTLLVTTGVEGGQNEKDRYAHMWMSTDGIEWHELLRLKKDFWPRLLQFGVIRFPGGRASKDEVVFTALGLSDAGETAFVGQLI